MHRHKGQSTDADVPERTLMPGQDYPDHTPEGAGSPPAPVQNPGLSRRSVLRRGAFAGAVGVAVAAGGVGVAKVLSSPSQADAAVQSAAGAAGSGPIVIYMADPHSDEVEIFAGTSSTRARSRAMASLVTSLAPR
jgi:hypothetical protein